jgi:hypothetical protein
VGVILALAGFLVLHRVLQIRGEVPVLGTFAVAGTVATAAVWAVLQAVDGVTLKKSVDAWAAASGSEKTVRFADAETIRWVEWGLQSYFRLLFGLTFLLFGAAIARTGIVWRWIGWVGIAAALLYMAVGVSVGHNGLEQPGDLVIQLLFLIFLGGVLVAALRQ